MPDRHAALWQSLADAMPSAAAPGLEAFADRVEREAYRITDADVAALAATDDEIFEAVLAGAFRAAERRLEQGLDACD